MAQCSQCAKRCNRNLTCLFCGKRPLCLRCVCSTPACVAYRKLCDEADPDKAATARTEGK